MFLYPEICCKCDELCLKVDNDVPKGFCHMADANVVKPIAKDEWVIDNGKFIRRSNKTYDINMKPISIWFPDCIAYIEEHCPHYKEHIKKNL